jgi:hypothetical protein
MKDKFKLYVMLFALPALQTTANLLGGRDADDVGADDRAARAIRYAIQELELWLIGNGTPVLPSNADAIVHSIAAKLADAQRADLEQF